MDFAVALFTFGLGIIATLLIQPWLTRLSEDIISINSLMLDFDNLASLSVNYWSIRGGSAEARKLEAQIHGAFKATKHFDVARICGCNTRKFRDLDKAIVNAITGGDFEGNSRVEDYNRIILVLNKIHEMKHLLRTVKRAQAWAR